MKCYGITTTHIVPNNLTANRCCVTSAITGGILLHPAKLHASDVERFLSDLVNIDKVSAATQKQALNVLVFLYRKVLDLHLDLL
ncbi:MAG: phage integrase N-terminal SAM-like domain-containing protein [Desulfuromonadales bacterium]|nr:phage integrase N-terminal SAM-like domain-containing protein [Desulfuromonadales bacterium]